ncbi:MAG: S-layer homology domain-containing protein, partial [Oscillospiraceae bacterium]|nr:S-layer homology domain-containing protein [Oscillospiraceae bacterium]
TEFGYEMDVCALCGASRIAGILYPTGHSYVKNVTEATCTEDGCTTYTCPCGDSYVTDYVAATGHSFGQWTVTREETCTEDGQRTRVCAACGTVETEVIPAYCPAESYSDLDTKQWYHEGVCFVLRKGIMKGKDTAIFAPGDTLTRAELVTTLYRLAGEPSVEGMENPFEDVAADTWYTDAVVWAVNNGVVNGTSATTFTPNSKITREQIAAILYRYSGAEEVGEDHLKDFTDAGSISAYAVEAMNWAVANGLI